MVEGYTVIDGDVAQPASKEVVDHEPESNPRGRRHSGPVENRVHQLEKLDFGQRVGNGEKAALLIRKWY